MRYPGHIRGNPEALGGILCKCGQSGRSGAFCGCPSSHRVHLGHLLAWPGFRMQGVGLGGVWHPAAGRARQALSLRGAFRISRYLLL